MQLSSEMDQAAVNIIAILLCHCMNKTAIK